MDTIKLTLFLIVGRIESGSYSGVTIKHGAILIHKCLKQLMQFACKKKILNWIILCRARPTFLRFIGMNECSEYKRRM